MEERIIEKEQKRKVIQWHPAFCSAAELEFLENRNDLEFQREVNLSKKPLEMDLLIIKKQPGVMLTNEIGHIFRRHNIIEYKNPNDSMTIDDFFKTQAYACLYKATKGRRVDEIKVREITVSMFRESYPMHMFNTLRALGMRIELYQDGIYYIKGNLPFHMQVIVTDQLDKQKHQSLKVLSKKLAEEDARNFLKRIERLTGERDKELIDSVLNVSISANQKLYEKMKGVNLMCNSLKEFFKEDYENIKKTSNRRG